MQICNFNVVTADRESNSFFNQNLPPISNILLSVVATYANSDRHNEIETREGVRRLAG